jgi:hypothetical protein
MNDGQFSSMTRAMIDAAKADAPSAAARAKVWAEVSGAVGAAGAATGASGGAGAAVAGGASAAKMLAIGALLGGAVTVGLAVTMLRVGAAPTPPQERIAPAAAPVLGALATQAHPSMPPTLANSNSPPIPTLDLSAIPAPIATVTAAQRAPLHAKPPIDPLAREAQLVSEARGALGRGDAARALQAVRAARALPSHQLAPEELAVEAQALRALGRAGDANDVDEKLRSKFPESALAR